MCKYLGRAWQFFILYCTPAIGGNENTVNNNTEKKEEAEEDIDFGYWESAILDDKPSPAAVTSTPQDVDLL